MEIQTGTVYHSEPNFTSSKILPGSTHRYHIYVPTQYDPSKPAALYVQQDSLLGVAPEAFERLIDEGAMPVCIGLGVESGFFPPSRPDGEQRSTRSQEYDGLGPNYANFIIEELLPFIKKEFGLNISDSPDMHLISGCSSGGICSWNAAWERNDFFRRVYMSSPTFSSFRGGDSMTVLMRKYETKPIRAYMIVGTDDMHNSAGDWYLEALSAEAAMKHAGYDFAFETFQDGLHGAGYQEITVFERAMRFLWQDWQTQPVKALGLPPRVADIVMPEEPWTSTNDAMPTPLIPTVDVGSYSYDQNKIWLNREDGTKTLVGDTGYPISGLALSSDGWLLYIAAVGRRFIDAMAIQPDGSLTDRFAHAHLHIADDCILLGATGICVDTQDRLYAATQLGIQTFSSRGHNNTILPLPGHLPVDKVAFGGSDNSILYAESGGRVFKRKVKTKGTTIGELNSPSTEPF